jgi:hypothetical protein
VVAAGRSCGVTWTLLAARASPTGRQNGSGATSRSRRATGVDVDAADARGDVDDAVD